MAYRVKLSGEDSSHHSNLTESVSLRKCSYYHYLTKKAMTHNKTFLRACPTSWWENRWLGYGM